MEDRHPHPCATGCVSRQRGERNPYGRGSDYHFAKKNRMNVIPKAKPCPKVSKPVSFFPRLSMTAPTYDNTNPTTIGLIKRLMP